ncbi:MAG: HAD-IIIA family hydrolase [Halobacteriovoraceae bacterium]|nr:HAD-IIIA family hydrolase [Halobacteriovoraceae bacterium]
MGINKIKAVFLDRDGVINKSIVREGKPYPPQSISEFEFNPGIHEVCRSLKENGFILIVVTNQPDYKRGTQKLDVIEQLNTHVANKLPIEKVYCCLHDNEDNCNCRKPKPGMILMGIEEFNIDPMQSFMIGDRTSDISAGKACGLKTIFIDYHYEEKQNEIPDYTVESIKNIVEIIVPKNEWES